MILAGLEQAAAASESVDVVHGSTVATNALLERKGARTAFVTTAGFEDLLEIGRQNRAELYNLTPAPRRPLDAARSVFRRARASLSRWNRSRMRPSAAELKRLAARLQARASANPSPSVFCTPIGIRRMNARSPTALQRDGVYVCASHEISPEFREYERGSTTVDQRLCRSADGSAIWPNWSEPRRFRIAIMQSNGGFLSAREAAQHAVRTVLSGPAGGVVGALRNRAPQRIPHASWASTWAAPPPTSAWPTARRAKPPKPSVDGFPIRVPMLDIHTVGAGGGSIARVDAGGLLRVGPESAGADPGPACYGLAREPPSPTRTSCWGAFSRCWAAKCRRCGSRRRGGRSHCTRA